MTRGQKSKLLFIEKPRTRLVFGDLCERFSARKGTRNGKTLARSFLWTMEMTLQPTSRKSTNCPLGALGPSCHCGSDQKRNAWAPNSTWAREPSGNRGHEFGTRLRAWRRMR